MTYSFNILGLTSDTNLASVTLECLNPADWAIESQKGDEKGYISETTYKFVAGTDKEHPTRMRVGHYHQPTGNGGRGKTNISVKLSTWTKEVLESGEIFYDPAEFVSASNTVGRSGVPNTAEYLLALQNVLSAYSRAVDTGALTGAPVDKLSFGVTHILV